MSSPMTEAAVCAFRYAGKERDRTGTDLGASGSGLDYFGARYYSSAMGRFMTPDWSASPEAVPYSHLDNPQSLNLYTYVLNNPLSKPDLDGHGCPPDCSTGNQVIDFFGGAANAFGSDNLAGAGRVNIPSTGGQLGQMIGDLGATLQGVGQMIVGTGGNIAGAAFDATGVGAVVGVPANVVSTAVTVEGAAAATTGTMNLMKSASDVVSSSGQKADQHGNKLGGSGKPQQHETNSNTREGANNKALNEGSGSVNHSNPKTGQPHVHAADADGNEKPNSTHHNYPE